MSSIEENNEEVIYEQKTQLEHIIDKPDMYIGSIVNDIGEKYIYDEENNCFKLKQIQYNPGLYKIIDEAISNASDHFLENSGCNIIKINISLDPFKIKIWNNSSSGIPVSNKKRNNEGKMEFIKTIEGEKVYIPELIFGHLLTSSNYNKNKARKTNGTNGLGIKLTNIYSKKFKIRCADGKKLYKQIFKNSMKDKTEPEITESKDKFVEIEFIPNLKMFNFEINNDFIMLIKKNVYDLAYVCNSKRNCEVYYNDELITKTEFNDYINMYKLESSDFIKVNLKNKINDDKMNNMVVGFAYTPSNKQIDSISFINNHFVEGGTHINFILQQIFNKLINNIKDEEIRNNVQLSHLKNNCCIFMNCYIDNPSYKSQSKDFLNNKFQILNDDKLDSPRDSPRSKLSNNEIVKVNINDNTFNTFINKIIKNTEIMGILNDESKVKMKRQLKKTDGKKTDKRIDIKKFEPAKLQGKSDKCCLMITEGDSAKTFAMRGRNVIGSDYYGVFPIRGKMLNTRNASEYKILANEEITKIKRIIGLKQGEKYTKEKLKTLNYCKIIILSDQDLDGFHIKGLVMNFIHDQWPELLQLGFCSSMNTPIKIASLKGSKNKDNDIIFYSEVEYRKWFEDKTINHTKYNIKYYKGLGSSEPNEIPRYFQNFDDKLINYVWEPEIIDSMRTKIKEKNIKLPKSEEYLQLAFDKKRADDRKIWLNNYNKDAVVSINSNCVYISDFINNELIHYSNYDNIRSIPRIEDGLKPSQRKILFTLLVNNIDNENKFIKVGNLASKVSDRTNYLHGEQSLVEAIVNMGQNFIGTNNINLLYPGGEFGTLSEGGKDHSAGRYIKTFLNQITYKIFRKEDNCILNYLIEEGDQIEPEVYYPIIPMVLINGSKGVGVGYSSEIPCFNPFEVIDNLEYIINNIKNFNDKNLPYPELLPYYDGFIEAGGKIEKETEKTKYRFITKGNFDFIPNTNAIKINCLPIGTWINSLTDNEKGYYSELEDIGKKKDKPKSDKPKKKEKKPKFLEPPIEKHFNNGGANLVDIDVYFPKIKFIDYKKDPDKIYKDLLLYSKINTLNMYLHEIINNKDVLIKYDTPNDIIKRFYIIRKEIYIKRKNEYLKILNNELDIINEKIRFMKLYMEKKIIIEKKKWEEIEEQLIKYKFKKLSNNYKDDEHKKNYNYLEFKIFSLSEDKFKELLKIQEEKTLNRDNYEKTPIETIWLNELEELKTELIKFYKNKRLDENNINKNNKNNKKSKKSKN